MNPIEARLAIIKMAQDQNNDRNNGVVVEPCKQSGCSLVNPNDGCGDKIGLLTERGSVMCPQQRGEILVTQNENNHA